MSLPVTREAVDLDPDAPSVCAREVRIRRFTYVCVGLALAPFVPMLLAFLLHAPAVRIWVTVLVIPLWGHAVTLLSVLPVSGAFDSVLLFLLFSLLLQWGLIWGVGVQLLLQSKRWAYAWLAGILVLGALVSCLRLLV